MGDNNKAASPGQAIARQVNVYRAGSDTLGKFKASRKRAKTNTKRTAIAKASRRRNRS